MNMNTFVGIKPLLHYTYIQDTLKHSQGEEGGDSLEKNLANINNTELYFQLGKLYDSLKEYEKAFKYLSC